jgi:hypothetical protein
MPFHILKVLYYFWINFCNPHLIYFTVIYEVEIKFYFSVWISTHYRIALWHLCDNISVVHLWTLYSVPLVFLYIKTSDPSYLSSMSLLFLVLCISVSSHQIHQNKYTVHPLGYLLEMTWILTSQYNLWCYVLVVQTWTSIYFWGHSFVTAGKMRPLVVRIK